MDPVILLDIVVIANLFFGFLYLYFKIYKRPDENIDLTNQSEVKKIG